MMPEAVVVDAVRTPIGRAFKGSLTAVRPDDLAAGVVDALLERNPALDPAAVDDLICGCARPVGEQAWNLARMVALLSRLPLTVGGTTVHRYCASSLQAIRMATHAVRAGEGDVFIAAGVESVSRVDRYSERQYPETRNPRLMGESGVTDAYIAMGLTAEHVAERYGVTREEMDRFAKRSQDLAVAARDSGFFDTEIAPVQLPDGTIVSRDDGPRPDTTLDRLAALAPAFKEDGTVTAGNSCPLNDGAAAVLVMSDTRARALGLRPRARIVASAVSALEPELMGVAPIEAIGRVLARAGMTIGDMDVVELNEAFAAQVLPVAEACDIPLEKLNPHGGAIALGHPFGMTGARIMTTLLNELENEDGHFGLEAMCVAGGQGMAMIVERIE
jgi:acetyl-CoA C-acetyltransferase